MGRKGGKGRGEGGGLFEHSRITFGTFDRFHAMNPMYSSRGFRCKPHHHIFQCVYIMAFMCRSSIPLTIDGLDIVWPLPIIYTYKYTIKLGTKIQCIVPFLFMLTTQKVFQEIQTGFLLVGYTHEDIDGYFNNFFMHVFMFFVDNNEWNVF